jgi:hypothetical protein
MNKRKKGDGSAKAVKLVWADVKNIKTYTNKYCIYQTLVFN